MTTHHLRSAIDMKIKTVLLFFLACSFLFLSGQSPDPWETWFERSDGTETPRYEATLNYCQQLADSSDWVYLTYFGESHQGRSLPLLIADKDGHFEPHTRNNKVVVLIQACIHPGESEGKDAGLMLLRDIAIHQKLAPLLDHITLLFIPIFNADGHERFGPYNRINQNGPKEMGWRSNAVNLNLNRDYLKVDAVEMKAWHTLFNAWNPDFFIDCHSSDGSDYQYVMTYLMEINGTMDAELTRWQAEEIIPYLEKSMEESGFPIHPYVSFRNWFDPESGIRHYPAQPAFSTGYTALRNRPGLLLETHMLKPYEERVESTYQMIHHCLAFLNQDPIGFKNRIAAADAHAASSLFREEAYTIRWESDFSDSTWKPFKGIMWEKQKSDLTGGDWYQYNGDTATFLMKTFDKYLSREEVMLPEAYIVPAEWKEVIKVLEYHGMIMMAIPQEVILPVETYRFYDYHWERTPYEGRFRVNTKARLVRQELRFAAGSVLVPMNQASSRLIAYALEPMANGSLLQWGFFNAIFEQKEYGETWIMEKIARDMIRENPELKTEFESKKAADPNFAGSQWLQLNWFYSQTPYWDEHKDLYPVGRIMDASVLKDIGD